MPSHRFAVVVWLSLAIPGLARAQDTGSPGGVEIPPVEVEILPVEILPVEIVPPEILPDDFPAETPDTTVPEVIVEEGGPAGDGSAGDGSTGEGSAGEGELTTPEDLAGGSVNDPGEPTAEPTGGPILYYTMSATGEVIGADWIPPIRRLPPDCPAVSLSAFAVSPNQRAVAGGLDAVAGTATGSVANLVQQVMASPAGSARRAALDSLSGEVYGTARSVGLQIADRSLRVITNRIVGNGPFLEGGGGVLISQRDDRRGTAPEIVRGQPAMTEATGWIEGYGTSGGFEASGDASATDFSLGGLAYGVDLGRDDSGLLGIAFGNSFTTFGNDLTDRGHVRSFQFNVYALKQAESRYGFLVLNYGHNRNDINRNIQIGNINSVASSTFVGHQFGAYGETGLNLDCCPVRFQPFWGMQYLYLSNSRAMENGGGGAALNVAAANLNTLQSHLGMRLIAPLIDGHGVQWTPYLNSRWVVDLVGQPATAFASLSGAPGASWVVAGNQSGRNFGMFGPGLAVQITCGLSLFANYDFVWGARYTSHTGSGGLQLTY